MDTIYFSKLVVQLLPQGHDRRIRVVLYSGQDFQTTFCLNPEEAVKLSNLLNKVAVLAKSDIKVETKPKEEELKQKINKPKSKKTEEITQLPMDFERLVDIDEKD